MYSFLISIHALPNITCRSSASKFTNFLLFHGLFHLFSLFTFFNLNLLLLNVVVVCHFCLVKKRRHVMCFFNVISQRTYPEQFSFIWYFPPISIILFSSFFTIFFQYQSHLLVFLMQTRRSGSGSGEEGCFLSGPESGASFMRGHESGGQTLDSKDGRYKLCKYLGHYIVILYLFSLICLNKNS